MFLPEDYLARFRARRAAEVASRVAHYETSGEIVKPPTIIAAADIADVLHDQLDSVIAAGPTDSRYLAVLAILMQPFAETANRVLGANA